jgi:hypothetical protein
VELVKNPLFARYFARCGARNEERGNRERPGGQLRFYEHVRSQDGLFARLQQAADLIWPHLMGGCHVQRQTLPAIGQVFTIDACRGFRFPPSAVWSPVAPRILGTARKRPHG